MRRFCVVLGAILLLASAWASEGNQLVGLGPIQESLAGTGVASPQDSTWVLMNPATLVDVDSRLDAYLMFLFLTRTLEPEGLGFASNKYAGKMVDDRPIFFPSFALTVQRDIGTFGYGIMGIEGDEVDFDHSRSTLARLQNKDRRSGLETAVLPFAYAHRFDNGWAVGGALLVEFSRLRTDSLTLHLRPTKGDYHWDESFGAGFQFGVYRKWDRWSFGATYRTQQHFEEFSRYDDLTQYPIDIPPMFQIGLAYRPTPKLELLADYRYIGWSRVDQFGQDTIPKGGLQWDDQHIAKLAAIWHLDDLWTLRGGFSYGAAPIDKKVIFVNGHFPAVAETHLTAGVSYRINDRSEIHASYGHAFDKEMTNSGLGDFFSYIGYGTKVSMEQNFMSLGYTWKF